jgi:hypothetical protein
MSEEKKPEDKREPLTDEDIFGGLVDVIFKRAIPSRSLPGAILFIVEYEGKEYRFGVLNKEAYEAVKRHGYKTCDGVIHLRIPKTCLREEGCGWITGPY